MRFKSEHMRAQFDARPAILREICAEFAELSAALGIEAVVTRITDPVPGESGVHPAGRAVDFRDEYDAEHGCRRLYTNEQATAIVNRLNALYPRSDKKKVCIHHSFKGTGRLHFHIQTPANPAAIRRETDASDQGL